MITRIELDGFKTFRDFTLELMPFQVIVGPNGVGKSNLFDALRLLSRLAGADLGVAFQDVRGELGELFTILPDGRVTNRMRLAVEMLVDQEAPDGSAEQIVLKHTRLRYEVTVERRMDSQGMERLHLAHERLAAIQPEADAWLKRQVASGRWRSAPADGRSEFIWTTPADRAEDSATIFLDLGRPGRTLSSKADAAERTFLSLVPHARLLTDAERPDVAHAYAVYQEMRAWRFLQLNPAMLRQPSPIPAGKHVAPDGANLAGALARIQATDPRLLTDIARDLASLVPGIRSIGVDTDLERNQHAVVARMADDRAFSARVLSEGTLRLLALATLLNDPERRGILCLEEPENGVDPSRIKQLARLLRDLATDLNDPDQMNEPLSQVLVNTHSPILISQPEIVPHVLVAAMTTKIVPRSETRPLRVTRIWPVAPDSRPDADLGMEPGERAYTLAQVIAYLNSADTSEAKATLSGSRASHA